MGGQMGMDFLRWAVGHDGLSITLRPAVQRQSPLRLFTLAVPLEKRETRNSLICLFEYCLLPLPFYTLIR